MPFTAAHPAITLPLTLLPQRWYSLTGLVIGSMTPDFEYFIRIKLNQQHGHTLWGLLYFDVPLGILLAYLFHMVVRNAFIDHLPGFLRARFAPFKDLDWHAYCKKRIGIVLASLLVGASSHLFWDAFTHEWGFFVERIPALQTTLHWGQRQLPLAKVLQHGSTALGMLVLALGILRMKPTERSPVKPHGAYWPIVFGVLLLVVGLRLATGLSVTDVGNMVVAIVSGGLLGLIAAPLVLRWDSPTRGGTT